MLADTQISTLAPELDAGPRSIASGGDRFCLVTGKVKPVADMIRFVLGPSGSPVPDLKRRLPGRGVWITATREALAEAMRRRLFARGFKREVHTADLAELTERLIERAALDALAMAHKAGKVAIGFAKAEKALAHEPVVGLIHAADAAPDGSRKLAGALKRRFGHTPGIAVIDLFDSSQLDLALGRSNVIHAALLAGHESETVLARVLRLACFRTSDSDQRHPSKPD